MRRSRYVVSSADAMPATVRFLIAAYRREPVSFAKAQCSCGSILPESICSGILAAFAPSEAKQHTAGGLASESIRFQAGRVREYYPLHVEVRKRLSRFLKNLTSVYTFSVRK